MYWLNRLRTVCAISCSLTAAPIFSSDEQPVAKEETIPSLKIWSQNDKDFTTSFYNASKKEQNFVFSPMSLQMCFALTSEIAAGATKQEILNKTFLPNGDILRHQGAKRILNLFNSKDENESARLSLVNSAWFSSDIQVSPVFQQLLQQSYRSDLHQADFSLFPEEACHEINAWVEQITHQQIQNLLPEGSINKDTKMVLVNALYMHAPWARPFNDKMTYYAPFFGFEKSLKAIPYMRQVANYGYLNEPECLVVQLPFKPSDNQDRLSLFVIMPQNDVSLEELEKKLTAQQLDHWLTQTKPTDIDLSLPKFKISSSIDAKRTVENMGLHLPFSSQAEFDLGDGPMYGMAITNIVHKAVFEVDENGGTGSAGTGSVIGLTSWKESTEVVIDHPFLVFVVDENSGLILFAGRVIQP